MTDRIRVPGPSDEYDIPLATGDVLFVLGAKWIRQVILHASSGDHRK